MVRFFGKATGKVDDKGRIVLPAIFRDALVRGGAEEMTLIVKKNVQAISRMQLRQYPSIVL